MSSLTSDHEIRKRAASAKRSRSAFVFLGCFLLLLGLGWVDYITGYELGFFVFYSAPVGLAAWWLGRWPGIFMGLAATLTWWQADSLDGLKSSTLFYFFWNSAVHFTAFAINAVTIDKIAADLRQRAELAARLARAQQALRVLAAACPACPVCGKMQTTRRLSADVSDVLRDIVQPQTQVGLSGCALCHAAEETAPVP